MPLFRRPSSGAKSEVELSKALQSTFRHYSSETEAQMQQDREALSQGGLPRGAKERVRKTVSGELPWMSTLDINDLYLADELRMTPLVQVAGSCFFHAATDTGGRILLDSNFDAANLVRAYYRAKSDALDRMRTEAEMAGAHAVVDAEYRFSREGTVIEFSAVGTAVTFKGVARPKTVLVSPMSGEEFYKLMARGYIPVNFALGYHWHCMPVGYRTRSIASAWNFMNQELTSVTQRFMETREYAMKRMVSDAHENQRVDGIVGVKMRSSIEETEIRLSQGYRGGFGSGIYGGGGLNLDGAFYAYSADGTLELPAFNTEFFATGAGIARISEVPLNRQSLSAYLTALP